MIENVKKHKGMILLQKLQRKILTKDQKIDFVGYEGESATSRYITPVGHPSGRSTKTSGLVGLGNMHNGHARLDEINYPSERW
jgi:hypothetical protein